LNNQIITTNGIHQKKNKTSHVQEKIISKQDLTTVVKNEQAIIPNVISSNDTDSKIRTTILPIMTTQPKKEKPTAK